MKKNPKRGLRRKFFITVVVPPLLPLIILGILGFFQLTLLVRSAIVDQLSKSADTTAASIEREFSIRKTVIKRSAEEILDVKETYGGYREELLRQRDACKVAISKTFDSAAIDQLGFIGNPDCDPFLAEFSRVINDSSCNAYINNINRFKQCNKELYLRRVDEGYNTLLVGYGILESNDINVRFNSFSLFFPETTEIIVINPKSEIVSVPKNQGETSLKDRQEKLFKRALEQDFLEPIVVFEDKKIVTFGYPISGGAVLGSYDVGNDQFLKPAWSSAPRPIQNNTLVYISDSEGTIAYPPVEDNKERSSVMKNIASGAKQEFYFTDSNKSQLGKGSRVADLNWAVMVASPQGLILQPLRSAQYIMIFAILVSIVISLIVGFVFVTSATNAIKQLLSGANIFAKGQLDHKIYLSTGDELQTLAETMNDMASQIKAGRAALIAKSKEFIHITSHELKAPMTGIIGYLSLILDDGMGKVDKKAKEYIQMAYGQTVRLRNLVTELLDVARIEANRIEFNIIKINPTKEIKDIIDLEKIPAEKKKIEIIYKPGKFPDVLADKEKFGIVVTNLISNAIKYNKINGQIVISHAATGNQLVTSVADNGLGMSQADQQKLFQKFFRTESGKASGESGTGLGLFITKQFVEGMGGKIWFESVEGKGTTFHFSIPEAT